MRSIAIILFAIGFIITGYNGYEWMEQKKLATPIKQPEIKQLETRETPISPIQDSNSKPHSYQSGDLVGELIIPSINSKFPVLLGNDPSILKKGVGMYQSQWTTLPSMGGHTVISGHRDTVFRRLAEIKNGDLLIVKFEDQLFPYRVNNIWITSKDDRSVIVTKDRPTLTITTCYPFHYVGSAPKRYIIQGSLEKQRNQKTVTLMKESS